ncbi:MAG: Glutamine--scyllo-inositol transaminase [Thermoleophilia bacterium]|nr:Glutamine--scyllo-inositol transaminase [Thermoleophilia bacterium]
MFMQAQPLAAASEDVVSLSQPFLNGRELELVAEVLQSGRLSDGPMRQRFEQSFAELVGTRHAVAVSSSAAAMRIAALTVGWSAGDEVIMSPLAPAAAVDAVHRTGATVRFADVDARTLTLSPDAVTDALRDRTAGIIASNSFGWPSDVPTFQAFAREHDIAVIEDASEAFGAMRRGRGIMDDAAWPGVFSFDQDRQLAIGEGGMLCTDDAGLAQAWRARLEHVRMSDVSCAIGVAQLEKVPRMLAMREHVAAEYARALIKVAGVTTPPSSIDGDVRSWFGYWILLDEDVDRDLIVERLRSGGIECATHELALDAAETCPVAAAAARRAVSIPLYPHLSPQQQHRVVGALRDALAAG